MNLLSHQKGVAVKVGWTAESGFRRWDTAVESNDCAGEKGVGWGG